MIIAFTGPSSSGKTTTMMEVKKRLEEKGYTVGIVSNVVRNVLKDMNKTLSDIRTDKDIVNMFQEYFIQRQLIEEYLQTNNSIILTERCVFDYFIYQMLFAKLSDSIKYMNKYHDIMAHYDHIFYFEPLELEKDGIRDEVTREKEIQLYDILIKNECHDIVEKNTVSIQQCSS